MHFVKIQHYMLYINFSNEHVLH